MQTYSTKDFYLAAYLIFSGRKLYKTELREKLTTFIFSQDTIIKNLVGNYYSLTARVEPMAYGNCVRSLKSIIWASKSTSNPEDKNNVKQFRGIKWNNRL